MLNMKSKAKTSAQAKLQDVAERAGVSVMTVSLALREDGAKRMSADTRERVLQAAKDLKYQPNARARAFRLGRTNVIGLYAGYGFINVRTPFFTEIVSGLQEGCERVRKDLLLHGIFHGTSPDDIYLELADGRIDGLVVTMPAHDPLGEKLRRSGLPVVAVSDAIEGLPCVIVDDAAGIREVALHLHARGHKKVEFAMSPAQPISGLRRRDEFVRVCADLGIQARVVIADVDPSAEDLVRTAGERGVTALVCWNDVVARAALEGARQCGLRIPEDLAITGFDGCPLPFADPFPLTTVVAPWADAACRSVELLDALLRGEEVPAETVLPVRFAPGSTS